MRIADTQLHAFATTLGLPPGTDDAPVCGARLTSNYVGKQGLPCAVCAMALKADRLCVEERLLIRRRALRAWLKARGVYLQLPPFGSSRGFHVLRTGYTYTVEKAFDGSRGPKSQFILRRER